MTLLEQFQNYKGSLVRIKTQLFWYGIGWDNLPGRVCLILDVDNPRAVYTAAETSGLSEFPCTAIASLLLIDGSPQWIWMAEDEVEIISDPA